MNNETKKLFAKNSTQQYSINITYIYVLFFKLLYLLKITDKLLDYGHTA